MDLKKIEDAVEQLMVLNIRTVVGEFKEDADGKLQYDAKKADVIVTQINLVDGDITTVFSEKFLEPPLSAIRDFHALREQQGQAIIQGNLRALVELAKTAAGLRAEEETPAERNNLSNLTGV